MNRSFALPRIGLVALMATALMAVAALFIAANTASGAPSRTAATTNVARTCRSPSPTATTRRCSRPRRRSPPRRGAKVTVFDAANDPKKQLQQFQTAIASKQYQAIVVQPIYGPQLLPTVKQAIKAGIKVVNIDQILGTNPATAAPPVPGMSGNVVFVQTQIGQKQGKLLVAACAKSQASPCTVGYLYSVKASSLDAAIRKGVDSAIKGHNIKIVAEGETFYQPANALKAAQTMLQAHPDINVIMGADQGATGAQQALKGNKNVTLIGYGGGGVGLAAREVRRVVRHGRAAAGDRGAAGDGVRAESGQDRQGLRRHRRPRRPAQRRRRHEGERLQVQG